MGVRDTGIFSDLDERLQIALPADLTRDNARVSLDPARKILVLYRGNWPVKAYPTGGSKTLKLKGAEIGLRPGDHAELKPLLEGKPARSIARGQSAGPRDTDGDGLPDTLDLLMGAHKTVLNGANYGGGYRRISYPWGDIPREDGVCTDVIVRAARNAGLDIQEELQLDIKRRPKAFPMVKKRNPNIDHRRVKTLLPYFLKHWEAHSAELANPKDSLAPGDIIFMDTFPKRRGPDHIGVISDRMGANGFPLVINNWTDGSKTAELDILDWVPVTHRFRIKAKN